MCAYWIPAIKSHEANDYFDDGETMNGRAVLNWMETNQIKCQAIFVVRYIGQDLGQQKIASYIEAAESAVSMNPTNQITGKGNARPITQDVNTGVKKNKKRSESNGNKSKDFKQPRTYAKNRRRSLSQKRGSLHRGAPSVRGAYQPTTANRFAPLRDNSQSPCRLDNDWPSLQQANASASKKQNKRSNSTN